MEQEFKKYSQFLIPAVSILVAILIVALLIVPNIMSIPKADSDISELQEQVDTLNKKINTLKQVDVASYQKDFDIVANAVPVDKEMPSAFGQLQYLLKNNGLILDDVSFSSADKKGANKSAGMQEFNINLSVTGMKDGIINFIEKIKDSPRVMKVSGIDLLSQRGSSVIQGSFSVVTYYQGTPNNMGSTASTVNLPSGKDREVVEAVKALVDSLPQDANNNVSGPVGKSDPFQ